MRAWMGHGGATLPPTGCAIRLQIVVTHAIGLIGFEDAEREGMQAAREGSEGIPVFNTLRAIW